MTDQQPSLVEQMYAREHAQTLDRALRAEALVQELSQELSALREAAQSED